MKVAELAENRPSIPRGKPLTARTPACGPISEQNAERRCLTCETMFVSSNGLRVFCSDRCRLLYWSARQILRAIKAGNADGLALMFGGKRGKESFDALLERVRS